MNKIVIKVLRCIRRKMVILNTAVIIIIVLLILLLQYHRISRSQDLQEEERLYNISLYNLDQAAMIRFIDESLEKGLKEDKGTGCEIPKIDPFSKEAQPYNRQLPPVNCSGEEWVSCYLSKCRVNKDIFNNTEGLKCTYRDILFDDDYKVKFGPNITLRSYHEYNLIESDHVEIICEDKNTGKEWKRHLGGLRALEAPETPAGRNNAYNVLIFGFDCASKNGFIRKLPKSLAYIKNELKAVIIEGYHVVGDGTTAALFPILTGNRELEHSDIRKAISNKKIDPSVFIFQKMRELGYRTLFMEDFPNIKDRGLTSGTFQRRYNGFAVQPVDHYLRNLFIEEYRSGTKFGSKWEKKDHCFGSIPQYQYMINITDQFFQLPDKKFCFTFMSDISHDNFNLIAETDIPTLNFLKGITKRELLKNTLIIIMGDHGTRFAGIRETYQGKLEERLPFMAIRLPDDLIAKRPEAKAALEINSNGVLTTPHDIYATVMDVLDLRDNWNPYKVKGSDLKRGMTLLEPIPKNRSCSEAGIEPHWCVCLKWEKLTPTHPMYQLIAEALVNKINAVTQNFRSQCALRTLVSIDWVQRKQPHKKMMDFVEAKKGNRYVGVFKTDYAPMTQQLYQVKITVDPGESIFEAIVTHDMKRNSTEVKSSDITRTNAYGNEPACVSAVHPELNFFCYCNKSIY